MKELLVMVTTILNCILTLLNLKSIYNNISKFNFSLAPTLKLSILSLEITKDIISQENYLKIKFQLENKGEYSLNNLTANFSTKIGSSDYKEDNISLDILGKNEKIIDEKIIYYNKTQLFEQIKNYQLKQEEGNVVTEYNDFYLKCQLNFENINNEKYKKDYLFILPIELNGRLGDKVIDMLEIGDINYKLKYKLVNAIQEKV